MFRILDEFHSLRWTPLQPKLLDYENAQFLVIGNASRGLDEATKPQPGDDKKDKDTPLEEMEKLEHEDELRVNHLNGIYISAKHLESVIYTDIWKAMTPYSTILV